MMINFGILGCGMIAGVHAEAIKRIENAALYGVADGQYERATDFAEKYGANAYHTFDDMLKDDNIHVICICTPSCFHASNAIQALEAGKHVVLEKPMALSCKEADEVISACERTGKLLTVICQLRFSEDIRKVKGLIEAGAFGRVSLCGLYMKYFRSEEYYSSSSWKGTLKYDGGGALMNQGIHGIDLIEYLMGEVTDVDGRIATLFHNIEVEDTATATLKFKNGALGVIVGSTCAYPGFARKIEIHGDNGYVIINEDKIEKLMINGEEIPCDTAEVESTASDPTAVQGVMHKMQIENLLCAIEGKESLLIDSREGKKAIRIIEEIYNEKERG